MNDQHGQIWGIMIAKVGDEGRALQLAVKPQRSMPAN
jgi:hypothetical protein